MEVAELPDDILSKIVRLVGENKWWRLGPILRAGRRGRNIVYSDEVLKNANIGAMCQDPGDVCYGGVYRSIFLRCLRAGNDEGFFYEGLRLVTEGNDIKGGIALLNRIVPDDGLATFACAIFAMCDGDECTSLHYLQIFDKKHQRLGTNRVRRYEIKLLHLLSYYRVAHSDSCGTGFIFPKSGLIPSPECAIECGIASASVENLCNNCYLWLFSRQVCGLI